MNSGKRNCTQVREASDWVTWALLRTCCHKLRTVARISYTVSTNALGRGASPMRKRSDMKSAYNKLCCCPPWTGRGHRWCRSDSVHWACAWSCRHHRVNTYIGKSLLNSPVPTVFLKQCMLEEKLFPTIISTWIFQAEVGKMEHTPELNRHIFLYLRHGAQPLSYALGKRHTEYYLNKCISMTTKLQKLQESSASVFHTSSSQSIPRARRLGLVDPARLFPVLLRDDAEFNRRSVRDYVCHSPSYKRYRKSHEERQGTKNKCSRHEPFREWHIIQKYIWIPILPIEPILELAYAIQGAI